jgi:hypothetical protein
MTRRIGAALRIVIRRPARIFSDRVHRKFPQIAIFAAMTAARGAKLETGRRRGHPRARRNAGNGKPPPETLAARIRRGPPRGPQAPATERPVPATERPGSKGLVRATARHRSHGRRHGKHPHSRAWVMAGARKRKPIVGLRAANTPLRRRVGHLPDKAHRLHAAAAVRRVRAGVVAAHVAAAGAAAEAEDGDDVESA